MASYTVQHVTSVPTGKDWHQHPCVHVDNYRAEGSSHKPHTEARLVYSKEGLHGRFDVKDRFFLARFSQFHDPVWTDSAVEFFVKPKADKGYVNFEMNACGALTSLYIRDHNKVDGGFKDFDRLTAEDGQMVKITPCLSQPNEKEIEEEIEWWVEFTIPFALLEKYVGPLGDVSGSTWKGNFYKCADDSSHPHWASWSPVDQLNFHLPHCFGDLVFA